MKKPSELFTERDKKKVATTIADLERETTGEIVPVVAATSGRYDRAEDIFGFMFALVLLALYWMLFSLPISGWGGVSENPSFWPVLLILVVGFAIGAVLAARFPQLCLPFVSKEEMQEEVERGALEAFQRFRVRATSGATGVLIYISLYEHMVRVIGDDGINDEHFQPVCDLVVQGFKKSNPEEALVKAIECVGELLQSHYPAEANQENKDELANTLVLLD